MNIPTSQPALLPQLNLWEMPLAQESIEESIETQIRPISAYSGSAPIKFYIPCARDEYLMLNEMEIFVKMTITVTWTGTGDLVINKQSFESAVIPTDNFFHSLFKKVNFKINNKEVTDDSTNYAYKAYFETLLGYTSEAKKSTASTFPFGSKESRTGFLDQYVSGNNYKSGTFTVSGPLHIDLAFQNKAMIGGSDLMLELVPNSHKFYFTLPGDKGLAVNWDDVSLYVTKHKVSKQIELAHAMAIQKAPVRYPFTRNQVRSVTVNKGLSSAVLDNLFIGVLQRRIFVTAVDESAYNSEPKADPLHFTNAGVSHIAAFIDGKQYPQTAFEPDFEKKDCTREYRGLLRALNENGPNGKLSLSLKDWLEKYPIYGFNFAPDMSNGAGAGEAICKRKYGQLSINLRFAKPLDKAVVFLVFAEFDSLMEIDQFGEVSIQ